MTTSQPSKEIYAIDIPEVNDFGATFTYNFFTPDESVNDTGEVSDRHLVRPTETFDASFLDYISTRSPRYVEMRFTPVKIPDVGGAVTDTDARRHAIDRHKDENVILNNLDKIVTEDHFSSLNFVSVNFQDAELEDKVFYMVSGTLEQHALDNEVSSNSSHVKSAHALHSVLPRSIKANFLTRALTHPKNAHGSTYSSSGSPKDKRKVSQSTQHTHVKHRLKAHGRRDHVKHKSTFFERLNHVTVSMQVNGKLLHDIVNRTISDPHSPFVDDLHVLHAVSKQVQHATTNYHTPALHAAQFKTLPPHIKVKVNRAGSQTERSSAEIVGYVIDKFEVTPKGETITHHPIVLDNPRHSLFVDFNVKYGTTYIYSVRTVAKFTLPAIDDDTKDVGTIQILVSSKSSSKSYVSTVEDIATPPPAVTKMYWDYEIDKLQVHTSLPPHSQ